MTRVTPPAVSLARVIVDQPSDLIEALPVAAFACDAQGRIRWFNAKAAVLWGREPALADDAEHFSGCYRLWSLDGRLIAGDEMPAARVLASGERISGLQAVIERPDGTRTNTIMHIEPVRGSGGEIVGAINCFHESGGAPDAICAQEQRAQLLSEVNHRLKNNIQMLQSLLSAAAREARTDEARELLADAGRRISAIAVTQSAIADRSDSRFDVRVLIDAIARYASQIWSRDADITAHADEGDLSNDTAIPIALIVNELAANSVKHARRETGHIAIAIRLAREGEAWLLSVSDDGPGFAHRETQRRASGLGLVAGLARQLGGTFTVTADKGARCEVRFPQR